MADSAPPVGYRRHWVWAEPPLQRLRLPLFRRGDLLDLCPDLLALRARLALVLVGGRPPVLPPPGSIL